MNLTEHAKMELNRILEGCKDEDGREMQKMMNENVLELITTFANQGHSGFSASYAIRLFTRLVDFKPLEALTGEDGEWKDETGLINKKHQQNKRCSAVFRENNDNSTAYYIYGKVFSDNKGYSWFTNNKSIIPVTFPFEVPEKPEKIYL